MRKTHPLYNRSQIRIACDTTYLLTCSAYTLCPIYFVRCKNQPDWYIHTTVFAVIILQNVAVSCIRLCYLCHSPHRMTIVAEVHLVNVGITPLHYCIRIICSLHCTLPVITGLSLRVFSILQHSISGAAGHIIISSLCAAGDKLPRISSVRGATSFLIVIQTADRTISDQIP